MALMLRKSVFPKNISLFKCIKGRSIASASNKKNPALLSAALTFRRLRHKSFTLEGAKLKRCTRFPSLKTTNTSSKTTGIRHSISSPTLTFHNNRILIPIRSFSTKNIATLTNKNPLANIPVCHDQVNSRYTSIRSYTCNAGCPCPFPCGPCGCKSGCSCLPPPCNTPPRCVQYMTGYYYYPYGTWFCGPYHVQGTCVPVPKPGSVPCGKCCPCPCICPAGTVFSPPGMGQASTPEGNPFSDTMPTRRTGISKLFPSYFPKPGFNPRQPIPPVISSIVCDPYMTLDENHSHPIHQDISIPEIYTSTQTSNMRQFKTNTPFSIKKAMRSPICHKRYRQAYQCPQLDRPRVILTKEERDKPRVKPNSFNYSSVPQFKNPFPRPYEDL